MRQLIQRGGDVRYCDPWVSEIELDGATHRSGRVVAGRGRCGRLRGRADAAHGLLGAAALGSRAADRRYAPRGAGRADRPPDLGCGARPGPRGRVHRRQARGVGARRRARGRPGRQLVRHGALAAGRPRRRWGTRRDGGHSGGHRRAAYAAAGRRPPARGAGVAAAVGTGPRITQRRRTSAGRGGWAARSARRVPLLVLGPRCRSTATS